jgi:molybdopterin synthase catalytic subunit
MKNKDKRKMGKCTCNNCGIEFEKPLSEIKRNEKLGRRNFCTRSCVGHFSTERLLNIKSDYVISKHSNNRKDEFTGLRDFIKRVKHRYKNHDLDLQYLKDLWDKQNVCVYTGVKLELPKNKGINNQIYTASLDRIDSSIGYLKGNVQFISIAANHAKGNLSHEDMILFCNLIYENKKASPK